MILKLLKQIGLLLQMALTMPATMAIMAGIAQSPVRAQAAMPLAMAWNAAARAYVPQPFLRQPKR